MAERLIIFIKLVLDIFINVCKFFYQFGKISSQSDFNVFNGMRRELKLKAPSLTESTDVFIPM